jgi:hypothetical protein
MIIITPFSSAIRSVRYRPVHERWPVVQQNCELLRENRICATEILITRDGNMNNQHEANNDGHIDVVNIWQEAVLLC